MNYRERTEKILIMLKEQKSLTVHELEAHLHISPATLRRDIKKMSENKMIERYHGGIRALTLTIDEIPIQERKNIDLENKQRIANYAASLIKPSEIIFIDSGTTTLAMIDFIKETNITVITNGILHTQRLKAKDINCFLLCGFLKYRSNALLGNETTSLMKKFKFDKAFLGCNAIDYQYGLTTLDDYEVALKKTGIEQSREVFILADNTKFGRRSLYVIDDYDQSKVSFITDKPQPEFKEYTCIVVE